MRLYNLIKNRSPWVVFPVALFAGSVLGMLYVNRWKWALLYLVLFSAQMALLYFEYIGETVAFDIVVALMISLQAVYFSRTLKQDALSWYAKLVAVLMTCLVVLLFLALLLKPFLYEPWHMPAGSMRPTIHVGDTVLASKYAYGYGQYSFPFYISPWKSRWFHKDPERGDLIVFALPQDTSVDYLKRVVGLPGDRIQMTNGRLFINGAMLEREFVREVEVPDPKGELYTVKEYIETLPEGKRHGIYEKSDEEPLDNTVLFEVPQGHYFIMGDNRDRSLDSRVMPMVGYIQDKYLVGKIVLLIKDGETGGVVFRAIEPE